jgi:GNAT superfamily N-acetyltransferase
MIRKATTDDLPAMRDVEVAAGEMFRTLGMEAIADDAPPTLEALAGYLEGGRSWVATAGEGTPVAYILIKELDRHAHIEQVTVHPRYARQGVGRQLIEEAASWAAARGLEGLTLTTFEEVPWNAPYYARLGFQRVPAHQQPEGIRQVVKAESTSALNAWPRVVMKRAL